MSDLPPGLFALLVLGLIFIVLSWPLILIRRGQIRQMADACSELARRTGLNYVAPVMSLPGILFSFRWTFRNAGEEGIYRSRSLSLSMTGSGGGWSGEYAESIPVQYCVIRIEIRNSAGFKLTIGPRWILSRLFDRSDAITGDERFDQRLIIQGKTPGFPQAGEQIHPVDQSSLAGVDDRGAAPDFTEGTQSLMQAGIDAES